MNGRLDDTLHLHKAWYNREETTRPVLAINVGFWANERFPRTMKSLPDREIKSEDLDDELYVQDVDDLYELQKGFGDYPFVAAANTAMCWIEAIIGCPVFTPGIPRSRHSLTGGSVRTTGCSYRNIRPQAPLRNVKN